MNTTKQRLTLTAAVIGAFLSLVTSTALITFPTLYKVAQSGLVAVADVLLGGLSASLQEWLTMYAVPLLVVALTALTTGLIWLVTTSFETTTHVKLLCTTIATLCPAVDSFFVGDIVCAVAALAGGFGCLGGILVYGKLAKACPKICNREVISYVVFGALTTVVSFVSQMLCASFGTPAWINTIGSWICAVAFAYIVNKLFVFQSHTDSRKAFFIELWLFIVARLASLGMELVFMIITVDVLHFSEAICKLIAQVFIIVANYIFSKLVIFKKKDA